MVNEDIGIRLRKARDKKRFSQKEVADKIGIHHSTLGKYELGKRAPDFETIQQLAEIYDVSPLWIITGQENEKNHTDVWKFGSNSSIQPIDEKLSRVLDAYRRLPEDKKKIVDDIIKALSNE